MDMLTSWELSVLDAIAARRTGFFDVFFLVFTYLGEYGCLWIALGVMLLSFKKTRPLGVCVALSLIFDLLLCNLCIKPLVCRVRPFALREVALLLKAPTDPSFPSGHTVASFAAAACLAFRKSRLAWPAIAVACLIAFSRLYLYLHFPTDVLGGIAIGVLCGALGAWAGGRIFKKKEL